MYIPTKSKGWPVSGFFGSSKKNAPVEDNQDKAIEAEVIGKSDGKNCPVADVTRERDRDPTYVAKKLDLKTTDVKNVSPICMTLARNCRFLSCPDKAPGCEPQECKVEALPSSEDPQSCSLTLTGNTFTVKPIFKKEKNLNVIDISKSAKSVAAQYIRLLLTGFCQSTATHIYDCEVSDSNYKVDATDDKEAKVTYLGSTDEFRYSQLALQTQVMKNLQSKVCEKGIKNDKFGTIVFAMQNGECVFNLYDRSEKDKLRMTTTLAMSFLVIEKERNVIDFKETWIKNAGTAMSSESAETERRERCEQCISLAKKKHAIAYESSDFDSCTFKSGEISLQKRFIIMVGTNTFPKVVQQQGWRLVLKLDPDIIKRSVALAEMCKTFKFNNGGYTFQRFIIGEGCLYKAVYEKEEVEVMVPHTSISTATDKYLNDLLWRVRGGPTLEIAPKALHCPDTTKKGSNCAEYFGHGNHFRGFTLQAKRFVYEGSLENAGVLIKTGDTGEEAVRAVCKASVPENIVNWQVAEYSLSNDGRTCSVLLKGEAIFSWPVLADKGITLDSGTLPESAN